MRNTKTRLALRTEIDATFSHITFLFLKPDIRKLSFAMRTYWKNIFFLFKGKHQTPSVYLSNILNNFNLKLRYRFYYIK